jgi:hypothetical protein
MLNSERGSILNFTCCRIKCKYTITFLHKELSEYTIAFSYVALHVSATQVSHYSNKLQTGWPGLNSWKGQEIFLYSLASRLALGPTQPPIQWVFRTLSPGVRRPEGEDDHSSSLSAQVKNGGAMPPLPHISLRCSASLLN